MCKQSTKREGLPTIWQVPDELWAWIVPILAELDPPSPTGRKRINARAALDAILFRRLAGVNGISYPKRFLMIARSIGPVLRWVQSGVFDRIWATLVERCTDLGSVNWEWQAADAAMGKARWGGSHWSESHRPGQTWGEAQPLGRGGFRTARCGGRGRQRP